MIAVLSSIEFCDQEGVLRTFKIINILLSVIRVVVPIIIIIFGTKDMMNASLEGKDDEMKLATNHLIKRIIAGFTVFLIPTIINVIFSLSAEYEEKPSEFASCSVCLTNSKECDTLIAVVKAQAELKAEKEHEKYGERHYISQLDMEKIQKEYDERRKRKKETVQESTHGKTTTSTTVSVTKYFNSQNVTQISGLTEQELIEILSKTSAYKGKAKMYIPYAKDLIAAEKNHGVNAFYLIGVYSLESGWMGSNLARECNNLGGVRFYRPYQLSNGKYTRNCRNGWAGFDSKSEFIDYHASSLERKYLTPGASHYYGYSVANVATDYGHGNSVDSIIQIATKVSSQ